MQVKIPMGTLNMVFDALTRDMAPTVGEYGNGLAAAFGNNHGVLANLPSVTAFEQVKFSVGGGFQFDMNGFQSDTPILCDYLHMAEEIKAQYGLNPMQVSRLQCMHWEAVGKLAAARAAAARAAAQGQQQQQQEQQGQQHDKHSAPAASYSCHSMMQRQSAEGDIGPSHLSFL